MNEPEFKAAKDMARRERCLPDAMYADMTGEQMEEISRIFREECGYTHIEPAPSRHLYPVFLNWGVTRAAKPHRMGMGIKRSSLQGGV